MPAKAKRKQSGTIRPGAQRVSVYNEGLCVYLWDEGHGDRLRAMMASGGYRGASPEKTFYENLAASAFAKAVKADALALAYTLEQDDEVEVEVAVGEALTKEELSVAFWLAPQYAMLSLPSGRLRIDTPNTMPLDPDEQSDEGGVVEVEPGNYLMTLYRVDWDELEREGKKYKGPQEFILLTPAASALKKRLSGPILKFQPSKEPSPGEVKLEPGQTQFECKFNFVSYWEQCAVNVTPAAAAAMNLRPGSRLRFRVEKFVVEALYLGQMPARDFMKFFGKERLEKALEPYAEFAISEWSTGSGENYLRLFRVKAAKCAPNKLCEKWTPATGELLTETFEVPTAPEVAPVEVRGGIISGSVLFASPEEVVLNIEEGHLDQIGAKPKDLLTLTLSDGTSRTLGYGESAIARMHFTVVTSELSSSHEATYVRLLEYNLGNRFFTLTGRGRTPAYSGSLTIHELPDGEAWPVVGVLLPSMSESGAAALRLTPFAQNGSATAEDWIKGFTPGAQITVRLK